MRVSRSAPPPPPPRSPALAGRFADYAERPSDATEVRQPDLTPPEEDGEEIEDDELFE